MKNKSNWTLGENKPNSNPIKPNFRKAQMNVSLYVIEDYRKNDAFAVQKNKANSNPISVKPKMSANVFATKDYENETAFRLQKNKPKQSQSQPVIFNLSSKFKISISGCPNNCARSVVASGIKLLYFISVASPLIRKGNTNDRD